MLHRADRVAVAGWLLSLRDFEEGKKAVIAHVEEVMADPLIRRVPAIARAGTETRRHPHRVHERHAEHVDIEVDRCLNVVGAEREMMDTARGG
jgi:hypothetical protein